MLIGKSTTNLYGVVDEDGNEVVPFIYYEIITFPEVNEFIVKKNKKFGLTNHKMSL
ncbi:WG containing repeat-containing protein [Chryseobacterium sp. RU37D]|uniref:WG repeat-containing protein n=1 Tax=Chryseobacterium sp. RU37D TaxID=1907397 RepID=UPI0009542E82|nr:WG repeat-containing protein [Chryseobacterium sp. RU37D]SIQ07409.1 WG containing repeat-containing protein [Chryseobacterium sp. RU37D]